MKDYNQMLLTALRDGVPMKRNVLSSVTSLSDRDLRRLIEKMQNDGYAIMNMSDGRGYYLATDQTELTSYLKQEYHRVGQQLSKLNKMKSAKYFAFTCESQVV